MILAIKKLDNLIYIDKTFFERFDEDKLKEYGYIKVVIDDKYSDCVTNDFNDDLTFNIEKYNKRKQQKIDFTRIAEIKQRLDELNKDFIQYYLGAVISNIEEKKIEFISLHNELRELLGKEPRIYK